MSTWGTVLLALDVVVGMVAVVAALGRPHSDDEGDGVGKVELPIPRRVHFVRTLSFYLSFAVVSSLLVGIRPGLGSVYQVVVVRVALISLRQPGPLAAYGAHLNGNIRLIVVVEILCLAVVLRADCSRKVVVGLHGAMFLVISIGMDSLTLAVAAASHLPVVTYLFVSTLANLTAGAAVMLRLLATTFDLPRPTTVPIRRPRFAVESAIFASSVVVALVAVFVGVSVLSFAFAGARPVVALVVFLSFPAVFVILYLALLVAGERPRPGPVSTHPPPLSVIVPAYNEESGIALTLGSLDLAAERYGAPVLVVVADDGSTDSTVALVTATMARFVAASGLIVEAGHAGKAGALNNALRRTTTELVVRVDADVVLDRDAFVPLPAWFANPAVGTVGALSLPREDLAGWIRRARLFECLLNFAFVRLAQQRVDAVGCIPGTFTAFRRELAVQAGGFVVGMNGEDADLTMQIGRLGFRAVVDPRIRSFEDVPATLGALREQRTRWNRSGAQVMARHSPLTAGNGCPRTWFMYVRNSMIRVTALLRPLVYVHAFQVALLTPNLRNGVGSIVALYAASAAPILSMTVYLAIQHGFARQLAWLPVMYPFTFVRRVFTLEAILTLPTRSVTVRANALTPKRLSPAPAGA
ncbi:MAG: glycosyltransferase [Acidimicrobiales bacterium]